MLFFAMDQRGAEETTRGGLHGQATMVMSLFTVLALAFGARLRRPAARPRPEHAAPGGPVDRDAADAGAIRLRAKPRENARMAANPSRYSQESRAVLPGRPTIHSTRVRGVPLHREAR